MKQLILDITKRLSEAALPDGYPHPRKNNRLFEYVDVDWGQLDYFTEFPPPVKMPCALIDIVDAPYTNKGAGGQFAIVDIQVRIIDLVLSNSSSRAPEEQRERALAIFDLIAATKALLHGWAGDGLPHEVAPPQSGYGPLTYMRATKINRSDMLREYRQTYRVQLTDHIAVKMPSKTTAKPKITVRLAKPESDE